MKTHTYKGVLITPATLNNSGFRWQARTVRSGFIYADTLAGIKNMIRDDHEMVERESVREKHRAIMNTIWSNSND